MSIRADFYCLCGRASIGTADDEADKREMERDFWAAHHKLANPMLVHEPTDRLTAKRARARARRSAEGADRRSAQDRQ